MNSFFRAFLSLTLAFQLIMTSSGGVMMAFAQAEEEVQEYQEVQEEEIEEKDLNDLKDSNDLKEGDTEQEVQDSQDDQDAEQVPSEEKDLKDLKDSNDLKEGDTEQEVQDSQDDQDAEQVPSEEKDLKDLKDSNDLKENDENVLEEGENEEDDGEQELQDFQDDQEEEQEDDEESIDENDQIDQNVQDAEELEIIEKTEEDLLKMLDQAFLEGTLKRHLPDQIGIYLKNEQVSEEMIREILKRFPVRVEHKDGQIRFKTESAVIPEFLLSRAKTASVAAGISTQGSRTTALQQAPVEFVSDRVLVKVNSRAVADQMIVNAATNGVEVRILQDGAQPLLRIDSTDQTSTIALLQKYLSDSAVVYQEPDYVYTADAVPNDPSHSFAWHHNNTGGSYAGFSGNAGEDIQSHDAWDIFTGDGTVIVAVVDTGVMLNHPDLQNNLWDGSGGCVDHNNVAVTGACPHNGFDYFDFDNNPSDESNHGTLVAGSVAADGNNGVGIAGVNWEGQIMALKTGTANSNKLSGSAIVNSINFAVNNGAKIINMSFSSSAESTSITTAITTARTNGVLVIASAGNNSQDLDVQNAFPCETALDNIICIAATNVQGTLDFLGSASTSNFGQTTVDLAAPGTSILSTAPVHTDIYTNNFENGASDVAEFTLTGGSGWGLKAGANNLLTSHTGGTYGNSESTFAEINQTFDLSSFSSGTLFFEMNCVTDDTFVGGFPVDGVGIDFSTNGGTNYSEVTSFNGNLTTQRGLFDTGPNGLPLITIGLIDTDFVSNFKFRFHFFSNTTITGTGCDIDEVKLRVNTGDTYLFATGTSFASPVTAGLASLIWEFKPTFTYTQVRDQLFAGGEALPALTTTTITGKRINSYRSLALLADPAVVNLRGFLTNGGTEFVDAATIATTDPFFSWTAPTGKGIISGYSFAVDGVPDAAVDTTNLNTTLSSLSQGPHTFQVFGVNDVGVTGTVAVFNFTVDTLAPDAPTGVALNGTNVVNAGNVTASALTGTAAEAATLNFTISDGSNPDVTGQQAVALGAFNITGINVSTLDEGPLTVSVTLTDAAANGSAAGNAAVTKDTQVASASNVQLNSNNPITAATANSVNLSFDTTEAGNAAFSVSDGVNPDVTGNVIVTGAGTTVTTVDHSTLNNTTLTISVTFTDSAGNAAAAANANLLKDTQVTAAATLQLNGGTVVNAGNVSSSSLSFATTEAGSASFTISDGANPDVTGTPAVGGAGTTTVNSLNLSTLNEGPLTVSVTFTDTVGNAAAATNLGASKDTQVAAVTNVQLNAGTTILATNHTSVDLTFDGVESGNASFTISDGSNPDVTGNVVVTGAGTTTVNGVDVSSLDDGTLNLSVTFTDDAANAAAAGLGNVQKDAQIAAPTSVQLNGGMIIIAATQNSVSLTFDTVEAGNASFTISDGVNPDVTGNTVVAGAGTTTVNSLNVSSLDDGTLNLSVVFTDTAGNVSTAGLGNVQKDATVVAASAVQLNTGNPVNAANETSSSLSFVTGEAGNASFIISDGANPDVTGNVAVTGAGTTTVNSLNVSSLDEGALTLSVTFTDTAGNVAAAAPGASQKDTLVSSASNVQLNGGTIINGTTHTSVDLTFDTTEAGNASYIISDGVNPNITGNVVVTGAGTTTVAGINVSALDNGTLNLSVTFTDDAGNAAAAGLGNVQKDAQAPAAPTGVQLNGSVTINATTENSISITGTVAEAGTLLYSIIDGVNPAVAGNQATGAGAFTIPTLDVSSLDDTTLTVFVTLTDGSGNTSTDGNNTVDKDTQVVSAAAVQLNGGTTIVAANQTSVALTFTTTEAGNAAYTISDGVNPDITGNVAVTGAGTTTVNSLNVSTLDDGTLNLSVVFTDTAGNAAAAGLGNVQKDSTVNSAANVQLNGGVTIIAATQTNVSLTFDTTEAGSASYTISDGVNPDVTGNTAVAGAGTTTVNTINVASLDDGTLNISVIFTDAASNPTPAANGNVQKDAQVSSAAAIQLNAGTTINAATQGSVALTFTTTEAGNAAYIISDGVNPDVTGNVAVTGAGTTTVNSLNVSSLDNGTLNLSVVFTDTAGNAAAAGLGSVQKDSQVAIAGAVQLNGGTTINNTTETSVALTFTTTESGNAAYTISDAVNPDITGNVAVTGAGTTTVNSLNVSTLDDGTLNLSVIFTDTAGNAAAVGLGNVQKDSQAPATPTGVQLNAGVTILAATQGSVDLTGSVAEAGTLMYTIIDGVNPAVDGSQAVGAGAFTVSSLNVSGLNDGTLNVFVNLTDAAGNTSTNANPTVQKDAQVTAAGSVQLNGGTTINAATQGSVSLTFTTTEAGNAAFTISDGVNPDVTGNIAVTGAGTTTVNSLNVSSLDNGTLNLSVIFTDTAGNAAAAGLGNVQKDTQVATAGAVQLNAGTTINTSTQGSVSLTFTATEAGNAAFTISDGVNPDVTGNTAVTGAGTTTVNGINVSSLDDGTLNVSVVFTDSAGNAAAAGLGNVQKDATVAVATSVQLNAGAAIAAATQSSVDLTFDTTEAGNAAYTISDGVNPDVTGNVVVAGAGTTTVNALDVSSLDDGTLNLSVVFTDTAGNAAAAGLGNVQKDSVAQTPTGLVLNNNQAITLATQSLVTFRVAVAELGTLNYSFSDGTNPDVTGNQVVTSVAVITVSNIDLASLNEGNINFQITLTDSLGNVSSVVNGVATKDTIVSSAASVVLNANSPIDGNSLTVVTLAFDTVELGSVTYVITDENNNTLTDTLPVTATGTFTISNIDVTTLADGLLTPLITFTDASGNIAASSLGAAVQKTSGTTVLSTGGSSRIRRLLAQDTDPESTPEQVVETQPEAVAPTGGGGASSGGGGGSVLGAKTVSEDVIVVIQEEDFVLPFRDVRESDDFYEAVKTLSQLDIVKGQGNGKRFDPNGVLDRAQALKMLLMLAEIEIPDSIKNSPFSDVELGVWFAPIISIAKQMGYVNGYADGSFIPWQVLNRAEALMMAYRIMGVEVEFDGISDYKDVAGDVWFAAVLHDAVERGLLSVREKNAKTYADPTADMTRAEFAMLIVGLLAGS
jgi:subtilisin family serine protease